MSKKIDGALNDLVQALTKHAATAADKKSSRGKLQKAEARVRAAATAYGAIVSARRGTGSPFSDIPDPRLDEPTVVSLQAERDALTLRRAHRESAPDAAGDGQPAGDQDAATAAS